MRNAAIHRKTYETDIQLTLELDGQGRFSGSSGVGFLDHMLHAFAVHSGCDLTLQMTGDLEVDCHHSVEDLGIVLGQALKEALGDKGTLTRYGSFTLPMDEALAFCALDVSGRPYLVFDCPFRGLAMGDLDCAMVGEFFRALAMNSGITLHLRLMYGENDHHKAEALFKAFAHALAIAIQPRQGTILSSKGVLE